MSGINCQDCGKFSLYLGNQVKAQFPELKEGVHGYCKGGLGIPAHYEHRESIRCIYFIAKENKEPC